MPGAVAFPDLVYARSSVHPVTRRPIRHVAVAEGVLVLSRGRVNWERAPTRALSPWPRTVHTNDAQRAAPRFGRHRDTASAEHRQECGVRSTAVVVHTPRRAATLPRQAAQVVAPLLRRLPEHDPGPPVHAPTVTRAARVRFTSHCYGHDTLVAFSGAVPDPDSGPADFTEASMNPRGLRHAPRQVVLQGGNRGGRRVIREDRREPRALGLVLRRLALRRHACRAWVSLHGCSATQRKMRVGSSASPTSRLTRTDMARNGLRLSETERRLYIPRTGVTQELLRPR